MTNTRNNSIPARNGLAIVLLAGIAVFFLVRHAFPRLLYSEAAYGEYYWFRAPWLFTHTVCGITATLTGPFQFIPRLRNKYLAFHRILGRIYLVCVFTAAVAAMYLAYTSAINFWYTAGLFTGAGIWIISGAMALRLILKRKTQLHRQWMIRNYVVTFFFIVFFAIYDIFVLSGTDPYNMLLLGVLPWACLLIPLGVTEILLRRKTAMAKR